MDSFSTAELPSYRKAEAWNELYSSRLNRVDFIPADRTGFTAELRVSKLGPINLARVVADRSNIERTRRHISHSSSQLYSFVLQARGRGVLSHCGHEAHLSQGDFALCDSTAPHLFSLEDRSEIVMVRVPADLLRGCLPSPSQFCGMRLAGSSGLASTAAAMVRSLADQVEAGFSSAYDDRVARHLLDVMSTSYSMAFDAVAQGSSVVRGRRALVTRYIEENLRDPALSPASIAAGLKISPRYLRMIFAANSETISAYILRRRLEECARQIADPKWAGHTLTEIAFSWGFNSAPHFTRSFRDRYGAAPREYRRSKLAH